MLILEPGTTSRTLVIPLFPVGDNVVAEKVGKVAQAFR